MYFNTKRIFVFTNKYICRIGLPVCYWIYKPGITSGKVFPSTKVLTPKMFKKFMKF